MKEESLKPRRRGPSLVNGERPLTPAERQRRWRNGAAKQHTAIKKQISINIDDETLQRLDNCADNVLKCSRSEAIRLLLNARMDQIDALMPALDSIAQSQEEIAGLPLAVGADELQIRLRNMLRGSVTLEQLVRNLKAGNDRCKELLEP